MSSLIRGWRQSPCKRWAAGCLLAACVLVSIPAAAQIRVNSSPNFVGSGARALGMGGAFIAIADDATAASWNPGGLTQLERPELGLVYSWKWFNENMATTPYLSGDGTAEVSIDELNYLSLAWPLPWTIAGRNLVLSLNYQRKYDMDRNLDFRVRQPYAPFYHPVFGGLYGSVAADVDYRQSGGLGTISPAFGFEVTEKLSLGFVANIWDSSLVPDNEWETTTSMTFSQRLFRVWPGGSAASNRVRMPYTLEKYKDVEGINYTFGALYRATERLTFGAVYHTAYSTDIDYTRYTRQVGVMARPSYYHSKLRIDWPAALGVGVAYRFPNDKLTLSLDVTRRDWDGFVQSDPRGGRYSFRVSPITGMPVWQSPMEAVYTVRFGGEYVFVDPRKARQDFLPSLRAGLFYDPEPSSGRRDSWWGIKRGDGGVDRYYGFSLGAGVLVKNRVNIDLAYEYRFGDGVRRDTLAGQGVFEKHFDEDVEQHLLYLSTVIYF